MSEYRLVMKGVVKTFPGVKALDHAQLELRPGKVMALMGENGAGKSTLMKCMFGIYKMDEGEIEYEGEKVNIPTPLDALNRGIAMVHQELQPIPARTVAQNIWLGRQFYTYMNLLIEWNKKINLTAIVEEKDIIIKHFLDSLTISKYINSNQKIMDIGTGAGFPGIPLKIFQENINMNLVDSLNKRITFLNEVVNKIELKNIVAIHSRAEDLAKIEEHREKYDIVVSRAVAKLNTLLEYMMPFIKVGGTCICMKGSNIEELEESKKAIEILGGKLEKVDEIVLPNTDIKRNNIIIKKIKNTPKEYPRKAGIPTKNPII